MSYIDVILGALLIWGAIRGFMKGLFLSLASFFRFFIGAFIAVYFSHFISEFLSQYVDWSVVILRVVSFVLTYILVLLGISIGARLLTSIANFIALGIFNKLLGSLFYVLKFTFLSSIILNLVHALDQKIDLIDDQTIQSSALYTPVKEFAPMLLPKIFEKFNEEL